MNIYVNLPTEKEGGGAGFVEVEIKEGSVTSISDLQKIARIIWPDTDIERISLSPAKIIIGMRLTNLDVKDPS